MVGRYEHHREYGIDEFGVGDDVAGGSSDSFRRENAACP